MVIDAASSDGHRAYGDIQSKVAVESDEADGASVHMPLCPFEFVDDLDRTDLRTTCNGSARKRCAKNFHDADFGPEFSANSRDRVKECGKPVDISVLDDFHAAVFADAAQVVSLQIDDHRQFRVFFFALKQFVF